MAEQNDAPLARAASDGKDCGKEESLPMRMVWSVRTTFSWIFSDTTATRLNKCSESLESAKAAGRWMRFRVTGACVLLGLPLVSIGLFINAIHTLPWWSYMLCEGMWEWGITVLALGVMASDRELIYGLVCFMCGSYFWTGIRILFRQSGMSAMAHFTWAADALVRDEEHLVIWFATIGIFKCVLACSRIAVVFTLARQARRLYPRELLDFFWRLAFGLAIVSVIVDIASLGLAFVLRPPAYWLPDHGGQFAPAQYFAAWIPSELALSLLLSRPHLRVRVQACLASRCEGVNVAAAISSWMSTGDKQKALRKAQRLFRAVRCDLLTEDMMASNHPNQNLFELSRPVRLGEADAFLSHSWHDEPTVKWAAIQKWRQEFKATHGGREPELWLDKFCLDQTKIDESLQCLPIFLSGCKQLLVIAGDTYLTRLWCIVELFVFLETGGSLSNLTVEPLVEKDLEAGQFAADFNAQDVTCSRPEDKDRLLAFVEAAFGDLDNFSREVRRVLTEASNARTETCPDRGTS